MKLNITRETPVVRTGRTLQLEGLFDVPPAERSAVAWHVDMPVEGDDWRIGLIVGASGSGKSTLAREAFPEAMIDGYEPGLFTAVIDNTLPKSTSQ